MQEVEIDELQFNYSGIEKPHIQNDAVTLHKRHAQARPVAPTLPHTHPLRNGCPSQGAPAALHC